MAENKPIDFTKSELEIIQKHIDNRWREKDHNLHLGDIEVGGKAQPAAVWEHKHYTFIIIKMNAFCYKNLFYFLRDKRFDSGVDEFSDLDECVDKLMKTQADFSLSKSTQSIKKSEDKK
ncbi:MAG: hypothetical protein HAW58_02845 [Candidatus Thioglobus sp.]|nr:hypothetical protein [Candidatus Thioglobus sp.]